MAGRRAITLEGLLKENEDQLAVINNYQGPLVDLLADEPASGVIWDDWVANNSFVACTNYTKDHISSMFLRMQPYCTAAAKRGPRPKSTWLDSFLCYLVWFKSGTQYDLIGKLLKLTSHRFEDNVDRVRPILHDALVEKWWQNRMRPTVLFGTNYPHAALLIDGHTSQTFRPKTRFDEAKIYYDGKNHLYGVKTEVAVMAHAPYYCLFASKHEVGSRHDYDIHKRTYQVYMEYLLKTGPEVALLPGDNASRFWASILDKGYIGPAADTPDFRRITPTRGALLPAEMASNLEINRLRVPVECFFGRLTSLFKVLRSTYIWDHSHFDMDFDIGCMLTNEHIEVRQLENQDREFYQRYITVRVEKAVAKEEKRKGQSKASHIRKKAFLATVNPR